MSILHIVSLSVTTYTTLEFEGNKLKLETRKGDNSELLDSIIIEKTTQHKDKTFGNFVKKLLYKFVELASFVYVKIDQLIKSFE